MLKRGQACAQITLHIDLEGESSPGLSLDILNSPHIDGRILHIVPVLRSPSTLDPGILSYERKRGPSDAVSFHHGPYSFHVCISTSHPPTFFFLHCSHTKANPTRSSILPCFHFAHSHSLFVSLRIECPVSRLYH